MDPSPDQHPEPNDLCTGTLCADNLKIGALFSQKRRRSLEKQKRAPEEDEKKAVSARKRRPRLREGRVFVKGLCGGTTSLAKTLASPTVGVAKVNRGASVIATRRDQGQVFLQRRNEIARDCEAISQRPPTPIPFPRSASRRSGGWLRKIQEILLSAGGVGSGSNFGESHPHICALTSDSLKRIIRRLRSVRTHR